MNINNHGKISVIVTELARRVTGIDEPVLLEDLRQLCADYGIRGHLALLCQPYLDRILNGQKTIESRFTKRRNVPFGHVFAGDVVYLKLVGGDIVGVAGVEGVWQFGPLSPDGIESIVCEFNDRLALEPDFVASRLDRKYATLMGLGAVSAVVPTMRMWKPDRRGWIVLK